MSTKTPEQLAQEREEFDAVQRLIDEGVVSLATPEEAMAGVYADKPVNLMTSLASLGLLNQRNELLEALEVVTSELERLMTTDSSAVSIASLRVGKQAIAKAKRDQP